MSSPTTSEDSRGQQVNSDRSRHQSKGARIPSTPPAPRVSTRKVLIRNIPHDVDEHQLYELLATKNIGQDVILRFVPAKVRANNRLARPGRLYLDIKKEALAKSVIESLDGYAFHETKDAMRLDVNYAPFQKIPRDKLRKDGKVGTLDRDPDYISFLEMLSKPREKLPSADVVADMKEGESAENAVPALVQFLNERRQKGKGKFVNKAERSRGSRSKSKKETKADKERAQGDKTKTKSRERKQAKDGSKGSRGGRNKSTVGTDKTSMEMASVRIARSKSSAVANSSTSTASVHSELDTSKQEHTNEGRARSGSKRGSRRSEGGGTSNTPAREASDNGRQRDGKTNKHTLAKGKRVGDKSESVRNDQPKKVYQPKEVSG